MYILYSGHLHNDAKRNSNKRAPDINTAFREVSF